MSGRAALGATERKSITMVFFVAASCTIMKPSPPMLPARGRVTASAKPTATAASTALPPLRRMSAPTWLAISFWLTTMPRVPTTGWWIDGYSSSCFRCGWAWA